MPKLDEIKCLLASVNIDILGLCETFLHDGISDEDLHIQNYYIIRKDRNNRKGGGILIYIKDNIPVQQRHDLNVTLLESIWIELTFPKSHSFLLNFVYRPPDSTHDWISEYENQFKNAITCSSQEYHIMGDFNINFFADKKSCSNSRWYSFIMSNGLSQLVTQPTRISKTSSTIIDHLYSSRPDRVTEVFVSSYSISDHFPVCFTRRIHSKLYKNTHTTISYRQFKKISAHKFKSDLLMSNVEVTETMNNPNSALNHLISIVKETLNLNAPLKSKRIKSQTLPGWFTEEIRSAIRTRDTLKRANNIDHYKRQRNYVIHIIRKSKRQFYNKSVMENKSTKFLWNTLNSLTKSQTFLTIPNRIKNGDEYIDDTNTILEAFNTHFTNISDIIQKTKFDPDNYRTFETYLNNKINSDFFIIDFITPFDVQRIIEKLDISKAAGLDNIGPNILKLCGNIIIGPIASIINNSIACGVFPDQLKDAYIIPLHKGSEKDDLNNYRPISILPTLSKIFERHIANRLKAFLEKHQLIHNYQSGFRQHHSCQSSLIRLVDSWFKDIDSGRFVGSVFLDLRKAFDLVDHEILLEKLRMYHFSKKALALMRSYLLNRRQCVKVGSNKSSFQEVKSGVPQGSILGPLLFLIYINDIPFYLQTSTIDLYADDSTLHSSGYNIFEIQQSLQSDLDILSTWCSRNNMSIHPDKTKCMIISNIKRPVLNSSLSLHVNNITLEQVNKHSVLGVIIDNNLRWNSHIDHVCHKLNSKLNLLKRINYFLNINTKKLFYNSYILSTMDYCCPIWCRGIVANTKRISIIQKKAAKIILHKPLITPSRPLFIELGWLSFENRCKFLTATIVHRFSTNKMPTYFHDIIVFTHNCTYSLRSTTHNDIVPFPFKSNFGKRTFSFYAREVWNSIPVNIRCISNTDTFKGNYKKYLMLNQ